MSQVTDFVTPGTPLTMAGLKTFLDACFAAAVDGNRGSSAPSNPIEGMLWWDTSGGATAEVLKRYTVAGGWVALMTVNITAGSIVGLSALLDEDDMVSDSALLPPSQQSVKAYVDANAVFANPRQTVLSSVLTSGLPSFISMGSGLAVNIAATAVPIRISFANGFDIKGPSEKIGSITADTTIPGLTANTTNFLFAERNPSTGAITLGKTTVVPVYSYTAPAHGAGQYWFSIQEMKMYLSNGSDTWTAKQVVFLGEAVTGAAIVTSVTNYALRGEYIGPWGNPPGTNAQYTVSHNIGANPQIVELEMINILTQGGYGVGEACLSKIYSNGTVHQPLSFRIGRTTVQCFFANTYYAAIRGTDAAIVACTATYWNARVIARRGW